MKTLARKYAFVPMLAVAAITATLALHQVVAAGTIVNSQPVVGGTMRESHLWVDPGPDENDSDLDAVTWTDFTITTPKTINHLEWWGTGTAELGFRIEIWKQDPNTIAYQPLGFFFYGGSFPEPIPEAMFETNEVVITAGPGGMLHYSLEVPVPFTLAANTPVNPRWFIGVIGRSHEWLANWKWARGTGGSNKTARWIHGEGPTFQVIGEGRALVVGDTSGPLCLGDISGDLVIDGADLAIVLGQWGTAGVADLNGDGVVDGADLAVVLGTWGACP